MEKLHSLHNAHTLGRPSRHLICWWWVDSVHMWRSDPGGAPQAWCICNAWVSRKAVWSQHVGLAVGDMGSLKCHMFGEMLFCPRFFSLLLCAEAAQSRSAYSNPACIEAAQSYCVHCSGNNCMWWQLLPPIGSLLSSQLFYKDNYF